MNAVSMSEAIGSAANASAAGNAIRKISMPRSSNLKTCLHIKCDSFEYMCSKVTINTIISLQLFHFIEVHSYSFSETYICWKMYLISSKKTKIGNFHLLSVQATLLPSAMTLWFWSLLEQNSLANAPKSHHKFETYACYSFFFKKIIENSECDCTEKLVRENNNFNFQVCII